MSPSNDGSHIIDGADGVGSVPNGDELCPFRDLGTQIVHVERTRCQIDIGDAHNNTALFFERQPRGYVGVVVQGSYDNFISTLQCAADGAAECERQRGHIRAKDDFAWIGGIEEISHRGARRRKHLISALACEECAVGIGIGRGQIGSDGVNTRLCDLGATWVVKEHDISAMQLYGK